VLTSTVGRVIRHPHVEVDAAVLRFGHLQHRRFTRTHAHTHSHFLSFLDAILMLGFGPQPVLANDMVLHRENMWPRNQKHKRNFMQDKTRQDNTRKDKTRRDKTR
jgi:hypothetical protein